MAGSTTSNTQAVYDEKGKPSTDAEPSSLTRPVIWIDEEKQELWLLGGEKQLGGATLYRSTLHNTLLNPS